MYTRIKRIFIHVYKYVYIYILIILIIIIIITAIIIIIIIIIITAIYPVPAAKKDPPGQPLSRPQPPRTVQGAACKIRTCSHSEVTALQGLAEYSPAIIILCWHPRLRRPRVQSA